MPKIVCEYIRDLLFTYCLFFLNVIHSLHFILEDDVDVSEMVTLLNQYVRLITVAGHHISCRPLAKQENGIYRVTILEDVLLLHDDQRSQLRANPCYETEVELVPC